MSPHADSPQIASEMIAGASMEDISTVLYLKVLQWAGYSEDLKVAELERMLEREGRLDDYLSRAEAELDGTPWREVHNQPLVANPMSARLASEFYPKLFPALRRNVWNPAPIDSCPMIAWQQGDCDSL
jgi:hypothetical protein